MFLIFLSATASAESRKVKISFTNVNFEGKIRLFEVKPGRAGDISETKIVKNIKNAPLEDEITGPVEVEAPGSRAFALVYENKSNKEVYFFASPHIVKPTENALAFHFECLCIHHVFRVPPKRTWYRIVRVIFDSASKNLPNEINHSIIGVSPEVAKRDYAKQIYSYGTNAD